MGLAFLLTVRYSLLTFFIGSLLEGGENDEGTEEGTSRSFGMMILRIFSEGEQGETGNAIDDDGDCISARDSSAEVVSLRRLRPVNRI